MKVGKLKDDKTPNGMITCKEKGEQVQKLMTCAEKGKLVSQMTHVPSARELDRGRA